MFQVRPDQLVLMFADASGAISYQYDGWRFAEANVYTQHAMGPGLVDLETARIGGETYISKSSSLKIDLTAVIITKKKNKELFRKLCSIDTFDTVHVCSILLEHDIMGSTLKR